MKRKNLRSKEWFENPKDPGLTALYLERYLNYGLKKNILEGINCVFKKYDKIIILEDDLEISKQFLEIINKLLFKYEKSENIYSIAGYSFPKDLVQKANINKKFFLAKRPSSWGWATWRNRWKKYNENLKDIKGKILNSKKTIYLPIEMKNYLRNKNLLNNLMASRLH